MPVKMYKRSEIVVSGISGRFPKSENIEEFWDNLCNGVDMVTADDTRWPQGYSGVPVRKGTLKNDIEEFDAEFFGINRLQALRVDPNIRHLLEVTWESILDSGYNPTELRGKDIGVYIGSSSHETLEAARETSHLVTGYDIPGSSGCMISNRVSYAFDFKGPSVTIDTYCSSSLMAFHMAASAIQNGEIEGAIVGGINLLLNPLNSLQVKRLGALCEDGKCKSFDASGDGYVRSEAIVAVYITKKSLARRSYATILRTKSNADGYKENGVSFPSGAAQERLMRQIYDEADVNPNDVFYVEPHGTGTSAGDPQELNAITSVLCNNRPANSPLLIGSTKSNMGHAEAAASLCAVVKVVMSIQKGYIPGNLHYNLPNPNIPGLIDGRLKVVTKLTKITGSVFGLNASGIGGSNIHVILKAPLPLATAAKTDLPVLVPFSGRTLEGVRYSLEKSAAAEDSDRNYLLHLIHENNTPGNDFRGFAVKHGGDSQPEISTTLEPNSSSGRPLWYVFPGMGTQWAGMGKDIIQIEVIRKSLETSAETMKLFGINLIELLTKGTETDMKLNMSLSFVAIGIAIVDFLNSLNLTPSGLIGHSAGELVCAYADGCATREEILTSSHYKDFILKDFASEGGMASVGLTWDEALKRCPPGVYPACHNSENNVTVTGPMKDIKRFAQELKGEGIFVREVPTGGVAYHSPYLKDIAPKFQQKLEEAIKNPKEISSKWISTSISKDMRDTELGKTFSPNYIINNFLSPVRFFDAVKQIPPNAIVLEVGSHALFQNILKKSLPNTCSIVPMMKKGESDNVKRMIYAVGSLFQNGLQPKFTSLYPKTALRSGPIFCRESISHLVKWNHAEKYPLLNYIKKSSNGDKICKISLEDEKYKYLEGHKIDGRILFPATGYLVLVWETYSELLEKASNTLPVEFEDVRFLQATVLAKEVTTELQINIFVSSGEFKVTERDNIVVTGTISCHESDSSLPKTKRHPTCSTNGNIILRKSDLYKDFRLRGYDYAGEFQGMIDSTLKGDFGTVAWHNNWIPFLDTMLQLSLVSLDKTTGLYLPTRLKHVILDPNQFHEANKDSASVSISYSATSQSLSTDGILLEGLKFTSTTKKQTIEQTPLLQTWKFVPYVDSIDKRWKFTEALKLCVDIVLENIPSHGITIAELIMSNDESEPLLTNIQHIIENSPQRMVVKSKESVNLQIVHNYFELQKITSLGSNGQVTSDFLLYVSRNCNVVDAEYMNYNTVALKRRDEGMLLLLKKKIVIEYQLLKPIRISNVKFDWLRQLQKSLSCSELPVWLIANESDSGIIGLVTCLRKERNGNLIRCLFSTSTKTEPSYMHRLIDLDLVMNVIDVKGRHGCYRSLNANIKTTIRTAHAYLNVMTTGNLSSVCWIQSPMPEKEAEVEGKTTCEVYYAPLNFRDIMLAVGKLSPDSLPGNLRKKDCILGLEFVGVDKCGNRVMGAVESMALATSVLANTNFLWTVPKSWSMVDAATVPIAYSTAYYALVVRGRMKSGESILITSGSGGVGQAAIAIAQSYNCEVFTTVGSEDKKLFLLQHFQELNETHILNSRSTAFESDILRLTQGRGVDLVLNSLADEKLQAATRVIGNGGRFLEIGKFDLSKNTGLGMEIFLKNISFHGILLDALFSNEGKAMAERAEVVKLVEEGISSGVVKPLPSTIFESTRAEEAFRYMASGKHIGKVVIQIRKEEEFSKDDDGGHKNSLNLDAIPRTYFYKNKVYILIGGLGGFGLEMATWFVSREARALVFVSRSGVTNGYQALQLKRWKEEGVYVSVFTKELVTVKDVECFFSEYARIGDIGGIFNLAMVLKDGLLENQTSQNFHAVMKPKYTMTRLFDEASRNCLKNLEYFVTFSSVSSVCGNLGQANYGMGNSCMERICERRRANNLSGLAIAMGAIGDVGVVQENMKRASVIAGTVPQRLPSCLDLLDKILNPDFKNVRHNAVISSFVLPSGKEETNTNVRLTLAQNVARILCIAETGMESRKTKSLTELGLDSLMTMEVKQVLDKNGISNVSNFELRKLTFEKLDELTQHK